MTLSPSEHNIKANNHLKPVIRHFHSFFLISLSINARTKHCPGSNWRIRWEQCPTRSWRILRGWRTRGRRWNRRWRTWEERMNKDVQRRRSWRRKRKAQGHVRPVHWASSQMVSECARYKLFNCKYSVTDNLSKIIIIIYLFRCRSRKAASRRYGVPVALSAATPSTSAFLKPKKINRCLRILSFLISHI